MLLYVPYSVDICHNVYILYEIVAFNWTLARCLFGPGHATNAISCSAPCDIVLNMNVISLYMILAHRIQFNSTRFPPPHPPRRNGTPLSFLHPRTICPGTLFAPYVCFCATPRCRVFMFWFIVHQRHRITNTAIPIQCVCGGRYAMMLSNWLCCWLVVLKFTRPKIGSSVNGVHTGVVELASLWHF